MRRANVVRLLIERTQDDFLSYHLSSSRSETAARLVKMALASDRELIKHEAELNEMLPNIDDDGRWEASYALNTGAMMLSLIELMRADNPDSYKDAVTLFFDTVDFKVQQALESAGISRATENQIDSHELMQGERKWFATITSGQAGSN